MKVIWSYSHFFELEKPLSYISMHFYIFTYLSSVNIVTALEITMLRSINWSLSFPTYWNCFVPGRPWQELTPHTHPTCGFELGTCLAIHSSFCAHNARPMGNARLEIQKSKMWLKLSGKCLQTCLKRVEINSYPKLTCPINPRSYNNKKSRQRYFNTCIVWTGSPTFIEKGVWLLGIPCIMISQGIYQLNT